MSTFRNLHVSYVGINAYSQSPLNGCIKDVLALDSLLREQCAQQTDTLRYTPFYLLAPTAADLERLTEYEDRHGIQLPYELPTFENVSQKAFAHLKHARDGDICVFYYSGHGSQTDAPEVFRHAKPDRKNETLVCLDSRDGARDLIDKEIAFLLWDALKGKEVHTLVIIDSCHAGTNTRDAREEGEQVRYRFQSAADKRVPFEEYLGYGQPDFYDLQEGNARIKIARYIHLAAARDSEKALETLKGGLFTTQLIELLRSGGTSKSYRELVQSLAVTVRNRNPNQNPVSFAREPADLDLQFLGGRVIPYQPAFELHYKSRLRAWHINAGALQGITPSTDAAKTVFRLVKDQGVPPTDLEVSEVHADYSVVADTGTLDTNRPAYQVSLVSLAHSVIQVGFSAALRENPVLLAAIENAYSHSAFPFLELTGSNGRADYLIDLSSDGQFMLTRATGTTPLFKRERKPALFLSQVDSLGKWLNTLELKNGTTRFDKDDFVFEIERIEGRELTPANRETVKGEQWLMTPDEEVVFAYVDNRQPAFRLRISIAATSALSACYAGALYLDSRYGIFTGLVPGDTGRLEKGKSPLSLEIILDGRVTRTLELERDPLYDLYQINEISDYLKIIVSSQPITLSHYSQESLELDPDRAGVTNKGLSTSGRTDSSADWAVFDFTFRIVGPHKEKVLLPGSVVGFPAFKIEAPEGFSASIYAATGEDIIRKQRSSQTRGLNKELDQQWDNLSLSAAAWGEDPSETAFTSGLSLGPDGDIHVLELLPAADRPLVLPAGKELLLTPNVPTTRAVEDLEEVIIPYGYDETFQVYYPLGYSDAEGRVHIETLPSETAGLIREEGPGLKSIGGSVKLFFRKLFRKKTGINTLQLYGFNADGSWKAPITDTAEIRRLLKTRPGARVVLLTHGLTGDTRHMVAALKELKALKTLAAFVLTYDYENLSTPVDDAANVLQTELKVLWNEPEQMPKLTIIAHSQGGLLARWMVEKVGGVPFVDHLILVGVASAGSELAQLGTSVFSLLTHALNVTGPLKYAITGLSFLLKALKSDPGRTLKDTAPRSAFIQNLRDSGKPHTVQYHVIIGDTALIARDYEGDDTFLQKVKKALAKNLVIPGFTHLLFGSAPNDIAVTIESATAIRAYNSSSHTRIVASNHLAYFRERLSQQELLDFLAAEPGTTS